MFDKITSSHPEKSGFMGWAFRRLDGIGDQFLA
jgi:hypothetical protein